MLTHFVQIYMRVLLFQNPSSICDRNLIVKIAINIYINNASFLDSLRKSRDYKSITISPAVLILSIKIFVFRTANVLVVRDIRKSNSLNLHFFSFVTIYVIFG